MPEIEQIRPFGPDSQLYDIRDNSKLPLGYGTEIPANSDLNDYTTPGKYYSGDSTRTGTITNKPSDFSIGFSLYVFGEDSNGLLQFAIETVATNYYGKIRYRIRTSPSSQFQDWRKVYTSTETIPVGSHTHAATDIDSGTLDSARLPTVPISKGGTGSTTAAAALIALSAAAGINLSSQITWATLYPVLSALEVGKTATFYCGGTTASLLTNGTWSESIKGVISSLGSGTYDFLAFSGTGSGASKCATWRITGLTSASATPTVNALTKYSIEGHAHSQYFDSTTSRTANTVLAAPNGSAGGASFRALVAADIPALLYAGASSSGGAATSADKLNAIDTRSAAMPLTEDQTAKAFFSNNGMPSEASWWGGLHIKGWQGAYSQWELVGAANNSDQRTTPLYIRSSNKNSAWGSWRKIFDESNPPRVLEDLNGPNGLDNNTRLTTADQDIGNSRLAVFCATSKMTTNKPPDGDGHILQFGWDNSTPNWNNQLYIKDGQTAKLMTRGRDSSSWGSWKRIYTEDDVIPIADGGTGKTTAAEALTALGGISKKLLWTNSSPTSAFSAQTVAISNMSTYSQFEIYFMLATSTQYAESRQYIYNVQGRVTMNNGSSVYTRDVKPVSTGVTFSAGTSTSYVIPYKIYGIKGVT